MLSINDVNTVTPVPCAVALGTFDGVHAGHRAVIRAAVAAARSEGLASAVFTFASLPKNAFLPPEKRIEPLIAPDEKARLIESLGVDILVMPDFTREIADIPAERFIRDVVIGRMGARRIVCGFDHRFGRGGEGGADLLISVCREEGVGVTIIPPVTLNGEKISSTLIRELIKNGRREEADLMLGRNE